MLKSNLVALTAALALSLAIGQAFAAGDVANGEKVYAGHCKACHSLDQGKNGMGSSLNGIVGSKAGSVAGFKYSDAMMKSGISWDEANLAKFLKDPKAAVPGNKMLAGSLSSDQDIQERHRLPQGKSEVASPTQLRVLNCRATDGDRERRDLERVREMLKLNLVALTTALAFSVAAGEALAAGDVANGEKVFTGQCKACHSLDQGKNGMGPSLNGVMGRKAGTGGGFKYSDAMMKSGITWDEASLAKFLKDPKADVPGTKMLAGALKSDQDIQDVIAFLKEKAK